MSARPFSETEFSTLLAHFKSQGHTRNSLLLVMGCGTGYRISELLTLRVGNVWTGSGVAREVLVARRNLKGGRGAYLRSVRGRRVPLSEPVREAIRLHLEAIGTEDPERSLLSTTKAAGEPMNRSSVFRLLRTACAECGIDPTRVSTHSLRKTFVGRVYRASGNDLIATQRCVGHTTPVTTARYLETDAGRLDSLILGLAA